MVTVGGNVVAELRSMNLETSAEMIDATTLTSTSKVNKAGTKSFTGSIDCFWDETDTNGQITLIEGASITVVYLFEGNTTWRLQLFVHRVSKQRFNQFISRWNGRGVV